MWGKATPGRDEILVALLGDAANGRWFALANLLLDTKVRGVASALAGSPLTLYLTVTDPMIEAGIPGGVIGGVVGDGGEPTKPYPPVPDYGFSPASPGVTVLSIGPRTIYYQRRVRTGWWGRVGRDVMGPHPDDRVAYLGALAKTTFRAPTFVSVMWKDAGNIRRRARTAQLALRAEYDRVFSLLVARDLLEAAEARRLTAAIDVHVTDSRTVPSRALPALEPLRR